MKNRLKPGKRGKNEGGFTLIEVMIAILLLLIGLLGVAGVAATIIQANAFSRQVTTATTLAEERMEDLKNTPYASLAGGSDTPAQFPGYTRTWQILTDAPLTGTSTVVVNVSFPWKTQTRNVQLQTIFRKP
jgi:prepilin-type N-terminal cleavage/methylation domain-containing protein